MLGQRGKTDWLDLSDYVVHFTKPSGRASAYENLMSVLGNQELKRGLSGFGVARKHGCPPPDSQRSVCFTEAPLGFLQRFVRGRSHHGLAFKKTFVVSRGGCPVWYVDQATAVHDALARLIAVTVDSGSDLWKLTPFIDSPTGAGGPGTYRFEWEREWRLNADLQFGVRDVAFLCAAEADHAAAREFFEYHKNEGTGPGYACPLIDPRWDTKRVRKALNNLRAP